MAKSDGKAGVSMADAAKATGGNWADKVAKGVAQRATAEKGGKR